MTSDVSEDHGRRRAQQEPDADHEEQGSAGPAEEATLETAPEDAPEDAPEGGLHWHVEATTPGNPFTSQLIFTEDSEPILWCDLDPITLNGLLHALTVIRDQQVATLTGIPGNPKPTPALHHQIAVVDAIHADPTPAPVHESTGTRSWWAQHKILTVFLGLIALIFLIGVIAGGLQGS